MTWCECLLTDIFPFGKTLIKYYYCSLCLQIVDGDDGQKHAKEALEIRRDLFEKLKWDCWNVLEAERLRKEFPSTKPVL